MKKIGAYGTFRLDGSPEIFVEKQQNIDYEGYMLHSDLTEALKSN